MASALSAVHRAGLLHRDVKPANIVEAAGVYKLIDFGIAAAERSAADAATSGELPAAARRPAFVLYDDLPLEAAGSKISLLPGSSVERGASGEPLDGVFSGLSGTVGYIAPERVSLRERAATASSDLYALGAVLFECLTGMLPAVAGGARHGKPGMRGEVLDGRTPAPPLAELRAGIPAGLSSLVDALLAPEPTARPRSAEAVVVALETLRSEIDGRARAVPPEDIGPFRGLERFEESDRDVYFGRRGEVAAVLETLQSRPLVALIGGSGSGKSSLARAGVLPAVRDGALGGGVTAWDAVVVVPGATPRAALGEALFPFLPGAAEHTPEAVVTSLARRVETSGRGVFLIVDQLEELVTAAAGAEQAWAAELLGQLGRTMMPGVRTLCTIRNDLLKDVLGLGPLGSAVVRGAVVVAPLGEAAWAEVIDQALAAYGYAFEDPALRLRVLGEVQQSASAMPLVQFALTRLWQKRDRERRRLTRLAFLAMGGISGALERHAEATFEKLAQRGPGARALTHAILLSFTTAQGTRATRSVAELEQFGDRKVVGAIVAESRGRAPVRARSARAHARARLAPDPVGSPPRDRGGRTRRPAARRRSGARRRALGDEGAGAVAPLAEQAPRRGERSGPAGDHAPHRRRDALLARRSSSRAPRGAGRRRDRRPLPGVVARQRRLLRADGTRGRGHREGEPGEGRTGGARRPGERRRGQPAALQRHARRGARQGGSRPVRGRARAPPERARPGHVARGAARPRPRRGHRRSAPTTASRARRRARRATLLATSRACWADSPSPALGFVSCATLARGMLARTWPATRSAPTTTS